MLRRLRVDRLTGPNDSVFDGIGMATTRRMAVPWSMTARWFQERRGRVDLSIVPHLRRRQPKVFIQNYRADALSVNEREFLGRHFVHDWGNVWVVGVSSERIGEGTGSRSIELLSSADYAVLAEDLTRVRIDGRNARAVESLAAGAHTLAVVGEAQQVHLTLAASAEFPVRSRQMPLPLFPNYSE